MRIIIILKCYQKVFSVHSRRKPVKAPAQKHNQLNII